MPGHGGFRPGAGAPRGGISETRRLLVAGVKRGLAYAGRARGLAGDEDEVATETVARIASDLIQAGQGRDVLAIFAQLTAKGGDEGDDPARSPLQQALKRLPGLQNGAGVPREPVQMTETPTKSTGNDLRPTDPVTVDRLQQPFFSPQQTLLPPASEPAPPGVPIVDATRGARRGAAAGAAGPPHPPPARPPGEFPLDGEILEKNFEGPPR